MKKESILDPIFWKAVEAIDTGDLPLLNELIDAHPRLLHENLVGGGEGYFKDPYLLFFIANNPIRSTQLPLNIVEVTRWLTSRLDNSAGNNRQFQLDYTLGLLATGRSARESGLQLELMNLLIDAGARPVGGVAALSHGNSAAAEQLLKRGETLTLSIAAGLGWQKDVKRLVAVANQEETLTALTIASFSGRSEIVSLLLKYCSDPNGFPTDKMEFHVHATPLHQAISASSLQCVKLLVRAGADLGVKDQLYDGTPLDWAKHLQAEKGVDKQRKERLAAIEDFLLNAGG